MQLHSDIIRLVSEEWVPCSIERIQSGCTAALQALCSFTTAGKRQPLTCQAGAQRQEGRKHPSLAEQRGPHPGQSSDDWRGTRRPTGGGGEGGRREGGGGGGESVLIIPPSTAAQVGEDQEDAIKTNNNMQFSGRSLPCVCRRVSALHSGPAARDTEGLTDGYLRWAVGETRKRKPVTSTRCALSALLSGAAQTATFKDYSPPRSTTLFIKPISKTPLYSTD